MIPVEQQPVILDVIGHLCFLISREKFYQKVEELLNFFLETARTDVTVASDCVTQNNTSTKEQ